MLSGCACPARAISTFSSDIAYSRSPAASGALQALGSVGEHLGVKGRKGPTSAGADVLDQLPDVRS
jgi:hypothetical protein